MIANISNIVIIIGIYSHLWFPTAFHSETLISIFDSDEKRNVEDNCYWKMYGKTTKEGNVVIWRCVTRRQQRHEEVAVANQISSFFWSLWRWCWARVSRKGFQNPSSLNFCCNYCSVMYKFIAGGRYRTYQRQYRTTPRKSSLSQKFKCN